jgi:aryl-alcohol dehydrogenase-like predicted oxidoreductase/DNA-binding transcriptional MerR regulator
MCAELSIHEAAARAGLSEHTLRYYEKIGLIPHVTRAPSGHRRYTDDDLGWIDLLKRLRATGMPVAKMVEFTQLTHAGDDTIADRLAILKTHRATVMEEINALHEDLDVIDHKITWYSNWLKEQRNMKRTLGRSGIEVSALGMGCWAIGGPWTFLGAAAGWGEIDDEESIRAIHAALDMGVNFFDTAANYGCGHSERILGKALEGRWDEAIVATKFGYDVDEEKKEVSAYDGDEEQGDLVSRLRADCEASLRRLGTDVIDVYQLHVWGYDLAKAVAVRDALEGLVKEGKIRTYGWSTDRVDAVRLFAEGPGCAVVQQQLNIFDGELEILRACDELDLASLNRGPLGMGLLTGKFTPDSTFTANDVRHRMQWFPGFKDGKPNPDWLKKLEAVREILTSGGRSLAQGALAWIWDVSDRTVPIPGFKTVEQVQENAGAMQYGPLRPEQMVEIDQILERESVLT